MLPVMITDQILAQGTSEWTKTLDCIKKHVNDNAKNDRDKETIKSNMQSD